jgi:hypothetical protein
MAECAGVFWVFKEKPKRPRIPVLINLFDFWVAGQFEFRLLTLDRKGKAYP